jgi:hypothetical protein
VQRPNQAYFFEYAEAAPVTGQVRLETLYTGLSTGTELTYFRGTNPYLTSSWDAELGLFRDGAPADQLPKPFLGYMEVAQVITSHNDTLAEGSIIAAAYGHKTGHVMQPEQEFWLQLPATLDPLLGIYLAQMGPICANGLLHAAHDLYGSGVHDLGDGVRDQRVLVTGGGVVGLLTALFALHCGAAEVMLASSSPPRLRAAASLGLAAVDTRRQDAALTCKQAWHGPRGRGADVVFQANPQASSLETALRALKPQGTVIDLTFYQEGAAAVHLGRAFHHNGLSIRCAQISRVPRGLDHSWDRRRLALATLGLLLEHGDAIREHLITHVLPLGDGPDFLAYLAEEYRPEVIQAVFMAAGVT